ncbi:amidohydrolase 3 [Phaeosphaeriaceae sp. PMI808]|nr:amidohydrolase 3 [Phaeosphaeriaceae sp. PMI808]
MFPLDLMGLPNLNYSVAYVNANIFTVNPSQPSASAFIVSQQGTFSHIGNSSEVIRIAKDANIVTVNLRNQFVMPGIHDAHMHMLVSGLGLITDANIGANSTSADIGPRIKEANCQCEILNAYQNFVLANIYNNSGFPDGKADRKFLDEAFPDRPVVVVGGAGHARLLNTKALEQAGYDLQNEPDVQGGKFFRRDDGSLTGEIVDAAFNKGAKAITFPALPTVKRALQVAIRAAHKVGVTSLQEASSNTQLIHALRELEAENQLKMNFHPHITYGPEWAASESQQSLVSLLDSAHTFKSKHVNPRFVKIILDGVPAVPLMTQSSLDGNGKPDMNNIQVPDVAEAVLKYDKMGMTVKIHATGDGATRLALDAIEQARKNNPNGPRHEIAHNNAVHPDDYKRYKPLNITAEMSPAFLFISPVSPLQNWEFEKMIENDIMMTIGSDWGAGPDPNMFPFLATIVERLGQGSKTAGGEMLVRMMTIQGAQAVGMEKEVGSIEVGKKANFVVMNQDLSKGDFGGASVVRTYFEGELVFDKNA